MATDPVTTANGVMLFIPANGHRIPGTLTQPPGMAQYVGLQFGSPSNQPKRRRWVTALEKFLKVETKTLGAIQILIGLVLIGCGGLSVPLVFRNYLLFTVVGYYPFWGGLFIIASGSVSVSMDKRFNINSMKCSLGMNITSAVVASMGIILYVLELALIAYLRRISDPYGDWSDEWLMKCSLGMNITSAVMASVGIILYVVELALNSYFRRNAYPYGDQSDNLMPLDYGISIILLLFCVLEFSITVSAAYFGCQAICCNTGPGMVALPCTVAEDGVTLIETSSVPPADNTADSSLGPVV